MVQAVQLGSPFALSPGVPEERRIVALVEVLGRQVWVEASREPGRRQPVAEVPVRVVEARELVGAQTGPQAVGPAHREVAGPQGVEQWALAVEQGADVVVVLLGVQAGRHRPWPVATVDRHRAGYNQAASVPMVPRMAGDGTERGEDVVIEQDDDLAHGAAHAFLERPQVAGVVDRYRAEPGAAAGEVLEDGDRGLVGAVDHHEQLQGPGVRQDAVDQRRQAFGPADRGDDDRGDPAGAEVPGVVFLAWGAVAGRTLELAEALGGEARCFFPPGGRRPPVLVRWALSAIATAVYLLRRRPTWVIVTNPPLPAALVAWAMGKVVGAEVALDSHPGGFGAQGDRVAARLQRLHRWLAPRVAFSLVAADEWKQKVESWGARATVVHEAPGPWVLTRPRRHERLRVLCVGRFAADEPWEAVVEAAELLPGIDVHLTGDPARAGTGDRALPPNVTLVGFLPAARYRQAVEEADVVLTLTTEPGSVMRAACEAVWAGRPLVVSDWPVARELFPFAVHVANDGPSIAAGLRRAESAYDALVSAADEARRVQLARWHAQRRALVDLLAHRAVG